MLLKQLDDHTFALWCPACEDIHVIGEEWEFKGTLEKPTFHPSVYRWEPEYICHFFIVEGQLLFLPDCSHKYADMTLRMPKLPDWFIGEEETPVSEPSEDDFYYPESNQDDWENEDTWYEIDD